MSRTLILGLVALLMLGSSAAAQDSVRLKSGGLVRGEVVFEDDAKLRVVTKIGEVREIAKANVERIRRGRPLSARTLERLKDVDESKAADLYTVAVWASEQRRLKRDAERVARRVLALDSEHAGARQLLGHVKALGRWYTDAKAATRAVEKKMAADGFVLVNDGWVKVEDAEELKSDPSRWMLVDSIWRKVHIVMTERGFTSYEGEWYGPDEKPLIEKLRLLRERTDEEAHGAQVGACRVYSVRGRESARETAENLDKARRWFIKTFEVDLERKPLDEEPISEAYVLSDQGSLVTFCNEYKAELGMTEEELQHTVPRNHALFKPMGHVIHLGENIWQESLVSNLGGSLASWLWGYRPGVHMPDWIWNAAAHNAEIAVWGHAKVQYLALDRYGRKTKMPEFQGRGIDGWKELLRGYYKSKSTSSLRELFRKHYNQLTAEDDVLGVVLMVFLLEKHKEAWLDFLRGKYAGAVQRTFMQAFKVTMGEIEHELKVWLGVA